MSKFTPGPWEQYKKAQKETKADLVLVRVGDFYEAWGDSALDLVDALGITLTHRHLSDAGDVHMSGIPFHSLDRYLSKDLSAFSVAVYKLQGAEFVLDRVVPAPKEAQDA